MNVEPREVDPRSLKLLDVNARYMRHEEYQQLVANVKRDGYLTSTPFCWTTPDGQLEVLSGNHRTQAAIDAGLPKIMVLVTEDELTKEQRVAIQLSHNSIAGEDDPATLKALYESLTDVDLRQYAGLDDKTLDLLAEVEVGALSEANLDFTTVSLVFLPDEYTLASDAFTAARKMAQADERWIAAIADHDRLLDALQLAHTSYKVGNVATALHVILSIFEAHQTDLVDGYLDRDSDTARHNGWVPLSSVLGRDTVPAAAAVVLHQAVARMTKREDVSAASPWQAIEFLAAEYLATPDAAPVGRLRLATLDDVEEVDATDDA